MIAGHHSENYRPITWWGQVPVYASTVLVAVYVGAMLLVTVLRGMGAVGFLSALTFEPAAVMNGFQIWRVVTYALVNPVDAAIFGYIWFGVQMYLLYIFGQEVEKFLGRRGFLLLYSFLVLAVPLTLLVFALGGYQTAYAGSQAVNFAIFIAFATIYPRAQIFFQFEARWIALLLVVLSSLSYFATNSWPSLAVLWVECGLAVLLLKRAGIAGGFEGFGDAIERMRPRRATTSQGSPRPTRRKKESEAPTEEDLHASIDPLLEKISRHGVSSLTKAERDRLEKARDRLMSKDKHS